MKERSKEFEVNKAKKSPRVNWIRKQLHTHFPKPRDFTVIRGICVRSMDQSTDRPINRPTDGQSGS